VIINFNVENYGSIKSKQTLSFEADKITHLEDYYVFKINGLRLLKVALIYGANASGKTTVLKALDFLRKLVLEPKEKKTDEFNFEPFLFDKNTPKQHTRFSIEFIQNEIKYLYEIELCKKAIVKEILKDFNPNKAIVFERTTDLENQYTEIKFGSKIKTDNTFRKTLEANTLWNNTVLGGYLKTNIELDKLKSVIEWFSTYLQPLIYAKSELDEYITSLINKEKINKKDILKILNKADLSISDIIIKEKEEDIPEGLIDFMDKALKIPYDELSEIINIRKINTINLNFEHTVKNNKFQLPFELESQGTKRYFSFAGILSLLLKDSVAFPIDELESSLHPDLYIHFLLMFLVNSKNSQIIATTHNREILNDKDLIRDDVIWITNKTEDDDTELYSFADFDSSVIRNTTNRYNVYKSGKLGGIPHLSDFYLEIGK